MNLLSLRPRPRWVAYLGAVLVTGAALGLHLAVGSALETPMLNVFMIPIIISGYWGGLGPGLLATLLAVLGANYYLLPPLHSFAAASSTHRTEEVVLLLSGGLISVVSLLLHRARDRAEEGRAIQRKAGLAMAASELRYRRLFETAKDGILILDAETGMVDDVNPFLINLLGFSRAQFLGKAIWELGYFRDILANRAHFEELKAREYIRYENLPLETSAGHRIDVEFVSNVYLVDGGKVIQCNIRDISARVKAEAALRAVEQEKQAASEAGRLKNEFLATMSHELRTPLNAILGFTEMVIDGRPGPLNEKQKEYLTDVHSSAAHLLDLINGVLDIAKVEAGKIELNPESFGAAEALENVRTVVAGLAQAARVELHLVAEGLGPLFLDLPKFKQVCYNLLSNAIKFTDAGGRVDAGLSPQGETHFAFRVTDTGIGIKEDDLPRLFREFEQLEGGLARRFEGTGLGLALTKKLVEAQGGTISVQSVYGQGSTFTVVLPLRTAAGAVSPRRLPGPEPAEASGRVAGHDLKT